MDGYIEIMKNMYAGKVNTSSSENTRVGVITANAMVIKTYHLF